MILTFAFPKGGTAKTTMSFLTLKYSGLFTGAIDFDPQANLTRLFIEEIPPDYNSSTNLLLGDNVSTFWTDNIFIFPSNFDDYNYDILHDETERMEMINNLESYCNRAFKDKNIIIDTSPNLSTSTIAAIMIADKVILPFQTSESNIDGIQDFYQFLQEYGLHTKLLFLPTMYDSRINRHKAVLDDISNHFNNIMLSPIKRYADFEIYGSKEVKAGSKASVNLHVYIEELKKYLWEN